jgi:hypothetical protein
MSESEEVSIRVFNGAQEIGVEMPAMEFITLRIPANNKLFEELVPKFKTVWQEPKPELDLA